MRNFHFVCGITSSLLAGLMLLTASAPLCLAQQSFFDFLNGGRPAPPPPAALPAAPKPPIQRPHTAKPGSAKTEAPKTEAPKTEAAKAEAQPAAEEPPPPYEPELLRLAEILGALTYLRDICGAADAEAWRARMQALLDAEAKTMIRKEHLAGAYNRGFHGYELSYRLCTPNAHVVIRRFLAEGEKIAHEVANRYGAS